MSSWSLATGWERGMMSANATGKWKDQVDAAGGAFNKLATNTAYLPLEKWL
jgi:hypothetical protein